MALALLLSVSGMLLSLSALAIATDNIKHEQHIVEVDAIDTPLTTVTINN